jgi:ABC-2 type transport system ATP-binding protein
MTTSPEPNVPYQSGSVVPYASSQSTLESNVPYAVVAHDLVRTFGQKVAVNHLNLAVRQGEFFGFLGPNGAGKSTTIKMLVGLLRPSAGSTERQGIYHFCRPYVWGSRCRCAPPHRRVVAGA